MDAEKIGKAAELSLYIALGFFLFYRLAHMAVVEYKLRQNNKAPVNTCGAVAYFKHPEQALVNAGRTSGDVHFITFHTDSGEIVKLYMNPQQFYSIPEGSRGTLTWQGERFWKFVKEE